MNQFGKIVDTEQKTLFNTIGKYQLPTGVGTEHIRISESMTGYTLTYFLHNIPLPYRSPPYTVSASSSVNNNAWGVTTGCVIVTFVRT